MPPSSRRFCALYRSANSLNVEMQPALRNLATGDASPLNVPVTIEFGSQIVCSLNSSLENSAG